MSALLVASAGSIASAPIVLVTMVACVIILSVRAWIGVTAVILSRRSALLIDVFVVALVVIFIVLVAVRFLTFA